MRNYSAQKLVSVAVPVVKRGLLDDYDAYSAVLLKLTTSVSINEALVAGRVELDRLLQKEGNNKEAFSDFLYVVERIAVGAIRNAMLPLDLRGPVVFALDSKREDGKLGSEPRPHYREISQVRKYSGRLKVSAAIKEWEANMYVAVCEHLEIIEPHLIPIDEEMVVLVNKFWTQDKNELKFA